MREPDTSVGVIGCPSSTLQRWELAFANRRSSGIGLSSFQTAHFSELEAY